MADYRNVTVRDHRTNVTVRDHRDSTVTVRDHRDGSVTVRPRPVREVVIPSRRPIEERERSRVSEASERILADPSSSIEDKLTALLILVSGAFDNLIDEKIGKIQKLQGMMEKKSGEALTKAKSSIDTETLELQRLTTKREQFFKLLQGVIEKYNGTAQGVLQKLNQ
jgi:hypothetical protein